MPNEMAIRLSDRRADELLRIHAEHTDWDEPEVRYLLRRKSPGRKATVALRLHHPDENEGLILTFGNVNVHIHATDEHVRIVLREIPVPPRAA